MRADRRIITALFVDIARSTSITERLDPEDALDLVGGAVSAVIAQVDVLDGTVKDLAGDGVLALFGAPVAHEDDAERAVVCGLRVVEAIADYALLVARRWQVEEFSVRVGIETGLAVLGPIGSGSRVEYGAIGDVLNLAARLQAHAAPGTVLVGEATRAMVEDRFTWGATQTLELKGKSTTVDASTVLSYAQQRLHDSQLDDAPLVGRADELARLALAVDGLRDGKGRVVAIGGEAGVGKSRLVAELHQHFTATLAGTWLEGTSVSYGTSVPYLPYRHLLLRWLELPLDARREDIHAVVEQRAAELPGRAAAALRRTLPVLLPGADEDSTSPETAKEHAFAAVAGLFAELAAEAPLALVLEDLHWADATSVALTEQLATMAADRPMLVLLTTRGEPALLDVVDQVRQTAPDAVLTVDLGPLARGTDVELLRALLGGTVLPRALESRVLDASLGNPLFIEEQVRGLVAAGAVARGEDGWRFVGDVPLHLAPTVERALVARIDLLDVPAREVLLAASVLGLRFHPSLLDELVGRDTTHVLRGLEASSFLLVGRTETGEETYRFRHAVVQEAAYNCLLRRHRVDLHRRAAAALATAYAGRENDIAATLGRHLAAAGDGERAVAHLRTAVAQAAAAFANDEAATLARDALVLLGARTDDVADELRPVARDLSMTRATALGHLSRHDETMAALQATLALTPAGDVLAVAEVHTAMGTSLREARRYDEALAEFDTAERCIGEQVRTDDGFARWLDMQLGRGGVFYWQSDVDRYSALIGQVEPYIEERATDEQRLRFYDSVRAVLFRRDRYEISDELIRLDRLVYDARRASDDPTDRAWAAFYHGFTLMWHRDLNEAVRLLNESADASEVVGDTLLRSRSLTYLMVAARLQGDVSRAADLIEPVVAAAHEAQTREYQAVAAATAAWVAYRRGDPAGVISHGQRALDTWARLPNPHSFDWMACLPLVAVAIERDDLTAALEWAEPMLAETHQRLASPIAEHLGCALQAAEAGDRAVAGRCLTDAVTVAGDLGWV